MKEFQVGPPLQTTSPTRRAFREARDPKDIPVIPEYGMEDLDRLTIYWVLRFINNWCHSPEPTGVLRDLGRMLIHKIRDANKIPDGEGETEKWVTRLK